jgi:hypothetical protein
MSRPILGGDSKQLDNVRKTSRHVGASAKAKEIDAVTRSPRADDRCVSINDSFGQPTAEHLMDAI